MMTIRTAHCQDSLRPARRLFLAALLALALLGLTSARHAHAAVTNCIDGSPIPCIDFPSPAAVTVGTPTEIDLTFNGFGAGTTLSAPFTIYWGDPANSSIAPTTLSLTSDPETVAYKFTYLTLGTYPITVQVGNGIGYQGGTQLAVTAVVNAAPGSIPLDTTVNWGAATAEVCGANYSLGGIIKDDPSFASWTVDVYWGDTAPDSVVNGSPAAYNASHQYCGPNRQSLPGTSVYPVVKVSDPLGTVTQNNWVLLLKDTTPPDLTVPANITVKATTSAGAPVDFASNVSAIDAVYGAVTPTCDHTPGATFPIGTTTVTCTATDGASPSNTSAPQSFSVTVDTPPTLNLPAAPVTATTSVSSGATMSFTVSASDAIDGPVTPGCYIGSPSMPVTSPYLFPIGPSTVTCTATNAAGYSTSGTFDVTVTLVPPTLTVNNVTVVADPGAASAAVNYALPQAGGLPVNCDLPQGSVLDVATTTTVTCKAANAAGTTTASFTITVKPYDTTPPTVTVPANIAVDTANPAGVAVTYVPPTATDDIDPNPTLACVSLPTSGLSSGSTFPVGTTTITCTATDASGNSATATFTVSVTLATSDFCKKDGWRTIPIPNVVFKNQGDCVSFFSTHGKNPPAYIDGNRDDSSNSDNKPPDLKVAVVSDHPQKDDAKKDGDEHDGHH